ncbi:Conserved repeat domain protein (fragment) [Hyella patelloides LEGE 07179]|uniref:Conserved repeat domain protein n=1 Tax=Hyella patelloides LEGE 07179 TaxID=945734 RepID=A0A563W353_9CYAN
MRKSYLYSSTGSTINSVISITSTTNNTFVYYDHWEDGYESDISNPVQSSTEIWGDGDLTNGIAPGTSNDLLNEGDVISLENEVTLPRQSSDVKYDGRDKIASSKAIAVTRSAWGTSPGTVLAGAVEVYDTAKYGTDFRVPVGQDVNAASIFEYTSLHITAASDNTQVTINKNDGGSTSDVIVTLNEGETYLVNGGVNAGATVSATNPVQAHLITGDVGAFYESRWFTLYPFDQWSTSYYSPVGTAVSSDPTKIYIYNPNGTTLTVNYETLGGTGSLTVDPGVVEVFEMPANSGARFASANGTDTFFAVGAVDADDASNATHDWGFSLVPEGNLTPTVVIGWGPSTADLSTQGNPIWVTAEEDTIIYVNYDGDSTTGSQTDPNGNQYDVKYDLSKLESRKIFDPDNDQTGMRIYTVDGTNITAAWGLDPATASAGNPFLDMGTTVLPLPVASAKKSASLGVDNSSPANGLYDPGDIIQYDITVNNDSVVVLGNVNVSDIIPNGLNYVDGSLSVNGGTFTGDPGSTSFPLDEGGLNIGNVAVGTSATVTFQMEIDPSFTGSSIQNSAVIDSDEEDFNLDVAIAIANEPSTTTFTDDTGTAVTFYEENDTIYIQVNDPDYLSDSTIGGTVQVTLTNPDTGDRETITLTEDNDTGVFTGSIPSSTSSGQGVEDATLYALAGNQLEVSYTDPSFSEDTSSDSVPAVAIPTDTKILYLSDTGDLDRIDPVASSDGTTAQSGTLGLASLVGVDFDSDTTGNSSPTNWNVLGAGNNTLGDNESLIDENGVDSGYELNIQVFGSGSTWTGDPSATNTLPSNLDAKIDNNIYYSSGITATWSGLDTSTVYDVYVFGCAIRLVET